MHKPKQRNKFRIFFGKIYYTLYKWAYWYLSTIKFYRNKIDKPLQFLVFSHKSILLRKLAGVDEELQKNKIINLRIAITKLNNLVIKPNETFSYWKLIGITTKLKGYKKGVVLHNGKFIEGVGGGLCQLSNLLYWMALHTPLTVKERWRHSYDVFPDINRTIPFGTGATCAYPYIDLQIVNNTKQNFQLKLWLTETELVGEWRTDIKLDTNYEVYETEHNFKLEWWGGYTRNNMINRKVVSNTNHTILSDEVITSNSALVMYNPFLENK